MCVLLCARLIKIAGILNIYRCLRTLPPCDLSGLTFSDMGSVPGASVGRLKMMPCITVASHTIEISLFHHFYCSRSVYRKCDHYGSWGVLVSHWRGNYHQRRPARRLSGPHTLSATASRSCLRPNHLFKYNVPCAGIKIFTAVQLFPCDRHISELLLLQTQGRLDFKASLLLLFWLVILPIFFDFTLSVNNFTSLLVVFLFYVWGAWEINVVWSC